MATTTATIFIGTAHQNNSGINPTHLIRLTENSRTALILHDLQGVEKTRTIIPSPIDIIDDIYLIIAVHIINGIKPNKDLENINRTRLDEIFELQERSELYNQTKKLIQDINIKVVFNILDSSILNSQIDRIKEFPNDFEITTSTHKKEYNAWNNSITQRGI
jgi:hypothetical protein